MPFGRTRRCGCQTGLECLLTVKPDGHGKLINKHVCQNKQNIYNQHFLTINNVTSTGTNESIAVRFYEQGLIRISNAYEYAFQNGTAGGTFDTSTATTSTRFFVTRFNDSGDEKNSYAYFYNLGDEEKYSFMTMQSVADHSGFEFRFGSAVMKRKSLLDGIRLFGTQSGSISGDFSLYGIRDLDV